MSVFDRIKVERISLDIPKLKKAAPRSKFLHLSDLHITKFGRREKRLVELVNREHPDFIFITGDMVVNYRNDFAACIETLTKLEAKQGIFSVLGNAEHTLNPSQHLSDFENALKDIQVKLLNNKNMEIDINGSKLFIIGVDDPFFHFDDFERAIYGVPAKAPTILLAHSPDILFQRAEALAINLLDSPYKQDHFKEWGWAERTYFSPESSDVFFQKDGIQTLRVQSRQIGVSVDILLLNPYEEIDRMLQKGKNKDIERLITSKDSNSRYPDLITVSASDINEKRMYGKWKKSLDPSALFGFRMDDLPPEKRWVFPPLVDPQNYFEHEFYPKINTKYHVWMRMKAYKRNPQHDSVYVQFSNSVDEYGKDRFRIGKTAYSKKRLQEMDLILAGHTHGGQVRIPFYGPWAVVTSMGEVFVSGLHQIDKTMLYVSRGIGYSVVPFRLFCPPEVTVFDFH